MADESALASIAEPAVTAPIDIYRLGDSHQAIRQLAECILAEMSHDPTSPAEDDLRRIALMAHELPRELRKRLVEFRLTGRPSGGFVISGLDLSDEQLGETPKEAQSGVTSPEASLANVMLLLIASILGDPFSHAAIQGGSLVLDICPTPGNEHSQLGSSSMGGLAWHNEDAYHEYRADWLLLMCLRNPQQVPTTFARIDDVKLADHIRAVLFEPEYSISPDSSHLSDHTETWAEKISILSGPPGAPFVRIDPEFMEQQALESKPREALRALIKELDTHLQDVVLATGDILVVDNRRAVHGRRPFEARYDGSDRWLRVVNVTADLRKSAAIRSASAERSSRHGRALKTH